MVACSGVLQAAFGSAPAVRHQRRYSGLSEADIVAARQVTFAFSNSRILRAVLLLFTLSTLLASGLPQRGKTRYLSQRDAVDASFIVLHVFVFSMASMGVDHGPRSHVPKWDGDQRGWTRYKDEVNMWLMAEPMDVSHVVGARLAAALSGPARRACIKMTRDELWPVDAGHDQSCEQLQVGDQ